MKFRPCIDLHQGTVKQIVGSTYRDGDAPGLVTNFRSARPASAFAALYRRDGLSGGHVIMLGPGSEDAARSALQAYPGGMQVGGGISPANAADFLEAGASHVIVTSYVFREGRIDRQRLAQLVAAVGSERLVLDLSCVRSGASYAVVTDRWQRLSSETIGPALLCELSASCAEFLVHATHVEGERKGIDPDLVGLLASASPLPVTYAGGVRSLADLDEVRRCGGGRVDVTVGSALDLFGGALAYDEVVAWHRRNG